MMRMTEGGRQTMPQRMLRLLPVVCVLGHSALFFPYTIDDAYITYTCAKNLAAGAGPLFVPGERVEATSTLLWTVLLAPFEAIGVGAPLGAKLLGAACALSVVVSAMRLFANMRPSAAPLLQTAVGLLVAASSPFVLWSNYGMENGLAALLLVLSIDAFAAELRAQRGWYSAVPIVLLESVRPEGFLFVALFVALRVLWSLTQTERRALLVPWLAALAGPLFAYELWGYLYFGHMLPNPVGAKIAATPLERAKEGLHYVLRGPSSVVFHTFLGSCLIAVPALFARQSSFGLRSLLAAWREHPQYLLALCVAALQISFAILVGGDWMPHGRFLSHVSPLVMVTLVGGYAQLSEHAAAVADRLPGVLKLLRIGAVAALLGLLGFEIRSARAVRGPVAELEQATERSLGGTLAFLNQVASPDDVVACSDIGRIGYSFKGHVYDWWGLANEEITRLHQALGNIDPATVLKHRPRFLVLYSNQPTLTLQTANSGMAVYSRPFLRSREFLEHYRQAHSAAFSADRYHVTFERIDPDRGVRDAWPQGPSSHAR